ncbi:MAG: sialidase family protein, partial [Planctomycetia bacterium]
PLAVRQAAAAEWQRGEGTLTLPSLQLAALNRAMWWNDAGQEEWRRVTTRLELPMPHEVTILPDGTLLWPLASQHPAARKLHARVACLASVDAGRTWQLRGMIADGRDTSWGYGFGEQSLARMPDGDLLCVMRTEGSEDFSGDHHLAAARSADAGRTWQMLPPLAAFSVTPHLVALANGMVAVVYGRPGVHVKASADGGRTWGEPQPIVGPSEREILAQPSAEWWKHRHDWSCANTSIVVTGPDRFLVAYSDFRHRDSEGRARKAIIVREVIVAADT